MAAALSKPKHIQAYQEPPPDLARLAAAYASGIVRNHPFVDGNKRTAYVTCRAFLLLNGTDLAASKREKLQVFSDLAAGLVTEEQLAKWIREHSAEVEPKG